MSTRLEPQPAPEALPPKPQPPVDYDCCGGGCADCELRIYLRELGRWQKMARLQGIPIDD
ncbi:oxidoreductase-like domain-containing protein [uncultured Nevskia sp.]|uniref:oxidoreductase-like domain-containing protein n=1 Tax=uncultured Nevskia sp. TaxID=228950 RepID=UPI0025E8C35D|nr:oxidoreductase-like domain-containing protein [uncultured Nevskia sp.]